MNAGDREKLTEALGELTKMEVNLNNFAKRGRRASETWTATAAATTDAARKKGISALAVGVTQLAKDGKAVSKDIAGIFKNIDSSIAEYGGTAKQYRDQVLAKRLASRKSFDLNGQRLITNVLALRDSKKKYPAQGDVDVTVTMNSLKAFSDHYHEMRILFAKL
jgi:hypothetical protein